MPYPAGHREKIRQKIVQTARRLFNQHGFENVSINEIMGAAGLTRGGLQLFRKQDGALCSNASLFLYRPNVEEHLEGGRD